MGDSNTGKERDATGSINQGGLHGQASQPSQSFTDSTRAVEFDQQEKAAIEAARAAENANANQKQTLDAIKKGERIALIIAAIVAIATIAQIVITICNNSSTSDQTNKLIRAAEVSAHSAAHNAAAAQSFSQSADQISKDIAVAVVNLGKQARAIEESRRASQDDSKNALDFSIENSHQDQRAWVSIEVMCVEGYAQNANPVTGCASVRDEDQSIVYKVIFKNTGKTVAKNLRAYLADYIIATDYKTPTYNTDIGGSVLSPGGTQNISTFQAPNSKAVLIAMGSTEFHVYGEIWYDDIFRKTTLDKILPYAPSI